VPCSVVRLSPYATVLRIRTATLAVVKTVSLLARCRACPRGFSEPCTRQRGFSWLASSRASACSFKFIVKLCRSLSTPRRPTAARRGLTLRSSGAPTACHQARATVQVCIFCSAGLASRRRRPLTSNYKGFPVCQASGSQGDARSASPCVIHTSLSLQATALCASLMVCKRVRTGETTNGH
jgi:hypothetical protein